MLHLVKLIYQYYLIKSVYSHLCFIKITQKSFYSLINVI